MKATVLLADAANHDPQGKVHALGVGWSVIGTPSPPIALMVILDCEWSETNTQHELVIELIDADGRPVSFEEGPLGDPKPAVHIGARMEVGRPPGAPPGTPLRQHLVMNLAPGMPLSAGEKYEFRLTIDGEPVDGWSSAFYVRHPGSPSK